MHNLIMFISSFGFGHLSRTVAVVRKLFNNREDINVHLIAPLEHCDFFMRSMILSHKEFKDNIIIHPIKTDEGLFYERFSLKPNLEKTINQAYSFYIKQSSSFAQKVIKRIEKLSNKLIYSDISPMAFEIAEQIDENALAVSNFDWYTVFDNLPVKDNILLERKIKITEYLKDSYNKSKILLKLPLSDNECFVNAESMDVTEISFFCRDKTQSNKKFRTKQGFHEDSLLIFLSFGYQNQLKLIDSKNLTRQISKKNIHLITSHVNKDVKNATSIPENETESQNWIGNCDLFIGKPGWGSMSECIINKVKMLLIPIKENIESGKLINKSLEIGGTRVLKEGEFENLSWLKDIREMKIPQYKDGMKKDGKETIVDKINQMF